MAYFYTWSGNHVCALCEATARTPECPGCFASLCSVQGAAPLAPLKRLAQLYHQDQRYKNRIHYLTEGDRKKRNHRLITRGAAVESIAPLAKVLTEVEFYTFAEKAFALPEVKALLMEAVNEHNITEQEERC